ncbi:MAG: adenylate/guanylate cyclase domain-containing protein [Planctomycetales bacterium]|nr:adenylate/guanylate cyclase domain-containing protein [Planctomycetales bacterium]
MRQLTSRRVGEKPLCCKETVPPLKLGPAWILAFSFVLTGAIGCRQQQRLDAAAESGVIDLANWEPELHSLVSLDGQWSFYPNQFVPADELDEHSATASPFYLRVPGTWNQLVRSENLSDRAASQPGSLIGTYHLVIDMPNRPGIYGLRLQSALSAYQLWVDGNLITSVGQIGNDEATTVPLYVPRSALFYCAGEPISVVIHIANFHHRDGGLYRKILLGTDQQLIAQERLSVASDMFVLASVTMLAGYQLIHFFCRRQELASLYFALGSLSVVFWHASNNEHLLHDIYPPLSSRAGQIIDYCSFFGSTSFFALFLRAMYPTYYPRLLVAAVLSVSTIYAILVPLVSMLTANRLIPGFQVVTVVASLLSVALLVRAVLAKAPLAGYIACGVVVFLATFLHDLMYSHGLLQTMWLSPYGLVFFIFIMSMTISIRFKKSFNHISDLKIGFEKFVPKRFLMRITDEDLSRIELGNAREEEIVVLFSDIRGFTAISEQLSPAHLLEYLNMYFLEMANVVKRHGGFIDKYIGDAVMALFDSDEPQDSLPPNQRAMRAALEMHGALRELNQRLVARGWPEIRIGVGIHFGPVVMGTVGAEFRMDSTALGDTVNIAARLEGLTKQYQVPIIISGTVLAQLPPNHEFSIREIGTVPIHGKQLPVQIFELMLA